jgi:hypothetical protein
MTIEDASGIRVRRVNVRVMHNRLRCVCGHQLAAYDFAIVDDAGSVEAVCSYCHRDLFCVEIG